MSVFTKGIKRLELSRCPIIVPESRRIGSQVIVIQTLYLHTEISQILSPAVKVLQNLITAVNPLLRGGIVHKPSASANTDRYIPPERQNLNRRIALQFRIHPLVRPRSKEQRAPSIDIT